MKLTDFYEIKKIPVTSVNGKLGDVKLNASDINAISYQQIGIVVPKLKNGVVPDSQLPPYAKLVNGKITYSNIPITSKHNLGGIQLGDGFQQKQNGIVDSIGIITKKQKQQKIDIIKIDGDGNGILTDNGTYYNIEQLRSSFEFDTMNQDYKISFTNNVPIVGVSTSNGHYYSVTNESYFDGQNTILDLRPFLIAQQQNTLNGKWTVFFSCTQIESDKSYNIDYKYKKISLKKALIYG